MFAVTLVIIFTILLTWVYALKSNRKKLPPLAAGSWPIVGYTFKILLNPEDLYRLLLNMSIDCLRLGGVVTICVITLQVYGIVDPEDAYLVLNSCLEKDAFYDYFKPWIGEGLITSTATIWKKQRKLLNPTFNQVVLDSFMSEFNKQARSLVSNLEAKAGKGQFDPAPYIEHATLQTICATAMGAAIDEKDIEMREEYITLKSKFLDGIVKRAKSFWLYSEFIYSFSNLNKRQQELAKSLHELTNAVIKKSKAELSTRNDTVEQRFKPFLELLLDMEKEGSLTETEVKEEVDSFTFAGSDTQSIGLMVVLLNIASYPDVQKKIIEELREVFRGSDKDVEKQELVQLNYLEAVIKETLRLYPTIPIIGRTLNKDVKLRNYTLPSGSRCFVSTMGVNRHSSWGPDAEQFRPERWLDPASLPSHYSFASFGLGKRKCIGHNYAMMSMKTTLVHVLRRYHVSGDVTQLVLKMEVLGRPVSKKYISIECREDYKGQ